MVKSVEISNSNLFIYVNFRQGFEPRLVADIERFHTDGSINKILKKKRTRSNAKTSRIPFVRKRDLSRVRH